MTRHLATQLPACTIDAVVVREGEAHCPSCLLREFGACNAIDTDTASHLNRHVVRKVFAAHETILAEGDEASTVGVIGEGVAAVVKYSDNGRRQIIGFLEAGDVFGLSSRETCFANIEALTKVKACLFPRNLFDEAMVRHPELTPELMRIVSNERVEAAEHELLLGQFSGRERLAAFLMRRADRFGKTVAGPCEIWLDTTRQDIGDYLGLSMENVSRGLNDMAKRGVISMPSPRKIILRDMQQLRRLAVAAD